MQKSNLPKGVRALKQDYEKGILRFDNPVQRAGSQWSLLQKSLLIHSILAEFPIPAMYFIKDKDEDGNTFFSVLDAKQRLTSVFEFIDGEYALHASTPSYFADGVSIELADKTFDELPVEAKDSILGCRFNIQCLEECFDDEVEEIFTRLNNSTPLSPIQKCRGILGMELSSWLRTICETDFMQHSISLTLTQARKECNLEVVLQSMLLLDARHEGYDYKTISCAEVTKYCHFIRDNYNEDKRKMIEDIFSYLSEAFGGEKHKFLRKSNIPMVVVLSKIAIEQEIEPERYKAFINEFSSYESPEYQAGMGSGNVKRVKTEYRLQAICNDFAEYFGLEGLDILGKGNEAESEVADETAED